ncbi:MAG: hypothetical protein AAF609_11890 [Cyanobacteria bacterium P01_C01_bin.120]
MSQHDGRSPFLMSPMLESLLPILMFSNTVSLEFWSDSGQEPQTINCQRLDSLTQQWLCSYDTELASGDENVLTGEVTDYVKSVACLDDSYARTIFIDSIPFPSECSESIRQD